jgi:hypothetical protein
MGWVDLPVWNTFATGVLSVLVEHDDDVTVLCLALACSSHGFCGKIDGGHKSVKKLLFGSHLTAGTKHHGPICSNDEATQVPWVAERLNYLLTKPNYILARLHSIGIPSVVWNSGEKGGQTGAGRTDCPTRLRRCTVGLL